MCPASEDGAGCRMGGRGEAGEGAGSSAGMHSQGGYATPEPPGMQG